MGDVRFSIISKEKTLKGQYPYIYVEDNSSYRELTCEERKYLEEEFHPNDGNRPYVKSNYYSKTPDGRLAGFLKRSRLPKGLKPGEVAPPKPWWLCIPA